MSGFFMIDLEGTELSESEKKILQHPHVGAVILFTRNFKTRSQLNLLITTLRNIRTDIFIGVDHEGGYVQRFQRQGFFPLPAAHVYGDVYDIDQTTGIQLAFNYGKIAAQELLACGVNLNFAPILDLYGESSVIGGLGRAFHSNPEVVAILAGSFAKGLRTGGMPTVGKHFPGHGTCHADSHIAKPIHHGSKEELKNHDLKPFSHLIQKNLLDVVMPAHITYSSIDSKNPAGFSKIWLQDILRGEFGFQGIILSDCLAMYGADIGDLKTRTEYALEAGCDMVIICNQTRELLYDVIQTVDFTQTDASKKRFEKFKQHMAQYKSAATEKYSGVCLSGDVSEIENQVNVSEVSCNKTVQV